MYCVTFIWGINASDTRVMFIKNWGGIKKKSIINTENDKEIKSNNLQERILSHNEYMTCYSELICELIQKNNIFIGNRWYNKVQLIFMIKQLQP